MDPITQQYVELKYLFMEKITFVMTPHAICAASKRGWRENAQIYMQNTVITQILYILTGVHLLGNISCLNR